MSRAHPADRPSPVATALFTGLIDDAAVFPPGLAPLPDAISDHRCLQQSPAAEYVGPLLVPVAALDELLDLVGDPADALAIGLVAAPGDTAGARAAAELAGRRSGLTVEVVEIALSGHPVDKVLAELGPLTDRGIGLAVEVGRAGAAEIAALAGHRDLIDAGLLRGKYRTGGVDPGAVPTAEELAAVIAAAVRAGLPIKFTAGLHHAVRTPEQHGVLNLMSAVRRAHEITGPTDASTADPADTAAVVSTVVDDLTADDAAALATGVRSWDAEQMATIRGTFTGFGCCGVLEPLTEAAELGLIPPLAHDITITVPAR